MCAKLKCCLNYEIPVYEDATKLLPSRHTELETKEATWYFFASDPLAGTVTYSSDPQKAVNLTTLTAGRAKEIIAMNSRGEKPFTLEGTRAVVADIGYQTGHGDVTRFDRKKQSGDGNRDRKKRPNNNERRDRRD